MSDPKRRDLKTKVREAVLAWRLEGQLTKDEILESYLNLIYLGNGAYGVKAAAERYFAKQPRDLTIAEAALIAGLIQAPENLNPITHPDTAARRRAVVLEAMVSTGAITEEQAASARQEPLPTSAANPLETPRDFFEDTVIRQLINDDPEVEGDVAEYLGPTQSARYNAVFRGGLRVYTTYDPVLQAIVQQAVRSTLPEGIPYVGAVAVVENDNGAVRAMYTGRDFSESQFNPVTAGGRQTGSTFKAITLAAALASGYSPRDRISGGSVTIDQPGEDWSPRNCNSGTMTLADAIARSNNCAFARLISSLGPDNYATDGARRVTEMAARLGINTKPPFSVVPSLTLGSNNTNVLDMAEAFSTFANDGIRRTPIFVERVVASNGEVIYEAPRAGRRALDVNVARTMTAMLRGVVERGTGRAADFGRPVAGKTGTTNDNTDAWFVGYTPQFTTSVWIGKPERPEPMVIRGTRVQGGNYPARIWRSVMEPLHDGVAVVNFTAPDESRWPTPQNVDEHGRQYGRDYVGEGTATTTSTEPPSETTTVATTAPPAATTTTAAPATTAPPTTAPPTTQPLPPPQDP